MVGHSLMGNPRKCCYYIVVVVGGLVCFIFAYFFVLRPPASSEDRVCVRSVSVKQVLSVAELSERSVRDFRGGNKPCGPVTHTQKRMEGGRNVK